LSILKIPLSDSFSNFDITDVKVDQFDIIIVHFDKLLEIKVFYDNNQSEFITSYRFKG